MFDLFILKSKINICNNGKMVRDIHSIIIGVSINLRKKKKIKKGGGEGGR